MSDEYNENMKFLIEHGMDIDEARALLNSKNVVTTAVQLPPTVARKIIAEITRFGFFMGPVTFHFSLTKDNLPRLKELLREATPSQMIEGQEFPEIREGEPVEAAAVRHTSKGFFGGPAGGDGEVH